MAKTKKAAAEAEAVEVEVMEAETGLEVRIEKEIKKFNVADAQIEKLREKYTGLKVKNLKDKEGLVQVKSGLKELVGLRNRIEDKRKELGEDYRKVVASINEEGKRLVALIAEIEAPLRAERDRIANLEKAEKERKEKEEQERLDSRVNALKEKGMAFDGSFYSIGDDIAMDIVTIKQLKDSDFEFLLAKVEMAAEKIRLAKEEEERKQAEAEAERKRQQEELERQQAEVRKQREEMEAERKKMEQELAEMREAKLKMEREQQELKEAAARAEQQRAQEELEKRAIARGGKLEELGYVYSTRAKAYVYENGSGKTEIESQLIATASEEYWNEVFEGAKIASKELADAYDILLEKMREEQRKKEAEEAAEKKRQEEEAEAARQAALPEIEKIVQYFEAIRGIKVPEIENQELEYLMNNANIAIDYAIEEAIKGLENHK